MAIPGLAPSVPLLIAGILLDAVFGDPRFRFHPIRLMGSTLSACESLLRRIRWDGYGGGCLLFGVLAVVWVALPAMIVVAIHRFHAAAGMLAHVLVVYTFLALRDLFDHVQAVGEAARSGNLTGARQAIGLLVGRDTASMDLMACRRAAIESLSENFVDGFISAVFWYVFLGLPGLLLFKVASTMDSMVGYKTPRYLRFGWCGARLDDVMNYVPARLSWLTLGLSALPFRSLSARKGWQIGLAQHSVLPGPNPGWSEATMAGLLQRRLIGPIWKDGSLVTELWLGDPRDPEGGSDSDLTRAVQVTVAAAVVVSILGLAVIQGASLWSPWSLFWGR